jgi:hypothetical protein
MERRKLMGKPIIASAAISFFLAASGPGAADVNQLGQPERGAPYGFSQGGLNWKSDTSPLKIHKKCEDVVQPENCNPTGVQTSRQGERGQSPRPYLPNGRNISVQL